MVKIIKVYFRKYIVFFINLCRLKKNAFLHLIFSYFCGISFEITNYEIEFLHFPLLGNYVCGNCIC